MTALSEGRPRMAFRVGITGAVALSADASRELALQVEAVLRAIQSKMRAIATDPEQAGLYEADTLPLLRALSPLAEGADRLLGHAALQLADQSELSGCSTQLEVVLPFVQPVYEARLSSGTDDERANSIAEFRRLLARADGRVVELDGADESHEARAGSYEAVGRFIVRNSDLIIAIWDESVAPKGRGGTSDTIRYSLRAGVPVLWLHASGERPARWLEDMLDLELGRAAAGDADVSLATYVTTTLKPAVPESEDTVLAGWLRHILNRETDPLRVYLAEDRRPPRQVWMLHAWLLTKLRRAGLRSIRRKTGPDPGRPGAATERKKGPAYALAAVTGGVAAPFRRMVRRKASSQPAALSSYYQHRYRTSYLLVLTAGALALIAAATGLAFAKLEDIASYCEAGALAVVAATVAVNWLEKWHERYVSYRILGELLRILPFLSDMGWALPGGRVGSLARNTARGWVAWEFAAIVRAAPGCVHNIDTEQMSRIKQAMVAEVIEGQLQFHERRKDECRGAAVILGRWGRNTFLATLACVAGKLLIQNDVIAVDHEAILPWFSLVGVILPALAAAFFGMRAYEEFEDLAEQSELMCRQLKTARHRIERIPVSEPLSSHLLGIEFAEVASIMLSDVAGWAQLFRLKAIEA